MTTTPWLDAICEHENVTLMWPLPPTPAYQKEFPLVHPPLTVPNMDNRQLAACVPGSPGTQVCLQP